jgi:MFS family permease
LSNGAIGLALGVATVSGAIGAASAARLDRLSVGRAGQQVVLLAWLVGAGMLGMASGSLPLAFAAYFMAYLANGVIEPVLSGLVNARLPAEQRATLLSVQSWMVSATVIIAFPAAGWLARRDGRRYICSAAG